MRVCQRRAPSARRKCSHVWTILQPLSPRTDTEEAPRPILQMGSSQPQLTAVTPLHQVPAHMAPCHLHVSPVWQVPLWSPLHGVGHVFPRSHRLGSGQNRALCSQECLGVATIPEPALLGNAVTRRCECTRLPTRHPSLPSFTCRTLLLSCRPSPAPGSSQPCIHPPPPEMTLGVGM